MNAAAPVVHPFHHAGTGTWSYVAADAASGEAAVFVATREARDATLAMPALIIPAVQVNIRAGALPDPHDNGVRYLDFPLDAL
jgi:hypothetical protein